MFDEYRDLVIQASYFVTAALFILGLKRMSLARDHAQRHHVGGRRYVGGDCRNIRLSRHVELRKWIIPAILVGGGYWHVVSGKRVAITDMKQMIALYNGMRRRCRRSDCGGGALPRGNGRLRGFGPCGRGWHYRRGVLQRQRHCVR